MQHDACQPDGKSQAQAHEKNSSAECELDAADNFVVTGGRRSDLSARKKGPVARVSDDAGVFWPVLASLQGLRESLATAPGQCRAARGLHVSVQVARWRRHF